MNLGPEIVSGSYKYLLVQSGNNPITLGANASVNWNAGGVVATTGNQNIAGIKVFGSNVKAVSFGNGSGVSNAFGLSADANDFGGSATVNHFGQDSSSNYFAEFADNNYFGQSSYNNYIAFEGYYNTFGQYALGNDFGSYSDYNSFGYQADNNSFGSDNLNTYLGTCLFTSTGRMRLANFTGAASQTGLRGEARVSGTFLYVCTGDTSGWGRVQLTTFL